MKKVILIIFILFLCLFISSPGILYGIGLYNIEGRPEIPIGQYLEKEQINGYKFLISKNIEMIKFEKLNPWIYLSNIFTIFTSSNAKSNPYTLYIWAIARSYNNKHLKNKTPLWHHISGFSLTIWLTRNLTQKQLLEGIQ